MTKNSVSDMERRSRAGSAMGRWLSPRALAVGALGLLLGLVSPGGSAQTLDDMSYSSLPGDRVQVKLTLSEPVPSPLSFAVDNPARVALDFPGVGLKLEQKSQSIGVGMARGVTAVEAGGRTRVVLNLVKLVPYDVKVDGNVVYLTLESTPEAPAATLADTSPARTRRAASSGGPRSIEGVDFRRGGSGEARVLVTLSDPSVVADAREEGGRIVVDFLNTSAPERVQRKLDVVDFATPVTQVDTVAQKDRVRVAITPTGAYEYLTYQSDNLYTVEVRPLTKEDEEAARKQKGVYSGERLSLNFQNIEVRAVLQLLADFTGLNLVASDTVSGSLTLRLKNVPWDQALDIILKSKGLAMRQAGNVIMVAPSEEIAAREKLELEAQRQLEDLSPLITEFLHVNYAKAQDVSALLKAEKNSLLSSRGNVTVDERTNTLLVRDTSENLANIRRVVAQLDIPVKQVLIESRVVIAEDNFAKDLGVKFGFSKTSVDNDGNFASVGGKKEGDTEFFDDTVSFHTDGKENFIVDLARLGPTLPGAALGLAVGKIGSWLLQLELEALQVEGRGEVLSNPRVVTANQKEAVIEQGTEIPYEEKTSSGATSVQFKKAVLSLKVTPQITPDDRIIMDLKVTKDAVGSREYKGVPTVDTRNVDTQVLVNHGETVVLGGIYERRQTDQVERVPFFGELPLVGGLFRNRGQNDEKSELLIFVTPRILKENLALR
jgi:type IV pilus assembly protein PilQ